MNIYHRRIIALGALFIALGFVFAAFRGFQFWYAGFVFFLWYALGLFNYEHFTSFWILRKKPKLFFLLYCALIIIWFPTDFFIGQRLTDLWTYPHYNSFDDWLRLYLIIYPFGCLAVLELIYFLSAFFGEPLQFVKKSRTVLHVIIDKGDFTLLGTLFVLSVLALFGVLEKPFFNPLFITSIFLWTFIATWKLTYHITHWLHYVAVLLTALGISVFLHEVPNVGVFEWRYQNLPFLGQTIAGVPLLVIFGWYVIVLSTLRLWIYLVLHRIQS